MHPKAIKPSPAVAEGRTQASSRQQHAPATTIKGNIAPSFKLFIMSSESITEAGNLTVAGINAQAPKLLKKLSDALKQKGLSVIKMVRIYTVIRKAVLEVQAILAEK